MIHLKNNIGILNHFLETVLAFILKKVLNSEIIIQNRIIQ